MDELYWRLSYWELSQKIKLRYGELTATQLCTFSAMGEIMSTAFGGGSKPKASDSNMFQSSGDLQKDVVSLRSMLTIG